MLDTVWDGDAYQARALGERVISEIGDAIGILRLVKPLSSLQELDVFNSSTQAVLTADLTMPDKLQYLIKRDVSSGGVSAALRIKATTSETQFRLLASGLAATNDYFLTVNGDIVQTNTADTNGKLNVTSLNSTLPILQVNSLQLWDASSNVVVGTTLP
jgi:hypothetical protein